MFLVGGWQNPSEKYEFVNWDDEIPEWNNRTCSSHHQPDIHDKQILRDSHTWIPKSTQEYNSSP